MKEVFLKAKRPDRDLPAEFTTLDATRLHFVVVAGRRKHFREKTYRHRRKNTTLILHYDNLAESAQAVIGARTY